MCIVSICARHPVDYAREWFSRKPFLATHEWMPRPTPGHVHHLNVISAQNTECFCLPQENGGTFYWMGIINSGWIRRDTWDACVGLYSPLVFSVFTVTFSSPCYTTQQCASFPLLLTFPFLPLCYIYKAVLCYERPLLYVVGWGHELKGSARAYASQVY